MNRIFRLAAGLLMLTAGITRAQVTNETSLDVHDDFESAKLSQFWDTDRFERGAVVMQTNIVRAGHGAAAVTVRAKEKFEAGVHGNKDSERAELLETRKLVAKEGEAYEQSFSLFIPTNFPIVPTRLVLAQWKQYCSGGNCDDDSPVLKLRYAAGVFRIVQQTNAENTTLFETKDEMRGHWLDFRFQTRFTTGTNGFIKAWLGNKQLVDYHGVTAYPENKTTGYPSPSHFYFKMGVYRDVMPEPWTVYFDEYRKKRLADTSSPPP